MKELSIQYIPHSKIQNMTSEERIEFLLNVVKNNNIALLEGQLKKTEEATLIAQTMAHISKKFKGIELATIQPTKDDMSVLEKIKSGLAKLLLGNRDGLTVIGPATVVEQIKQDPKKLQLFSINLNK